MPTETTDAIFGDFILPRLPHDHVRLYHPSGAALREYRDRDLARFRTMRWGIDSVDSLYHAPLMVNVAFDNLASNWAAIGDAHDRKVHCRL